MDHASSMHLEGGSRPSLKFQNHAVGQGGRAGKSTKFQCQLQRRPRDPWPSQAIIQETEVGERERRGAALEPTLHFECDTRSATLPNCMILVRGAEGYRELAIGRGGKYT